MPSFHFKKKKKGNISSADFYRPPILPFLKPNKAANLSKDSFAATKKKRKDQWRNYKLLFMLPLCALNTKVHPSTCPSITFSDALWSGWEKKDLFTNLSCLVRNIHMRGTQEIGGY